MKKHHVATVNGFGTSLCPARGLVYWGAQCDYDAVECFVFFFLPVFPFRALHTFDWHGNEFQYVVIRWSYSLLGLGLLRRWLWAVVIGSLCGIAAIWLGPDRSETATIVCLAVAACLGAAGLCLMHHADKRHRNIRWILGRHEVGSSDPATWPKSMLQGVKSPEEMHGMKAYAHAVEPLLDEGKFSQAMWAARLSVRFEGRKYGECLTDMILGNPKVKEAITAVSRRPENWAPFMTGPSNLGG